MSNQLSIQTDLSAHSSSESLTVSKTAPPTAQAPKAKPVPLFVNPSFQFDPTVGLVVIAFHDDSGTVTNSIPSQRQLEAYRDHRATPPGETAPPALTPEPRPNAKTPAG